MGPRIRRPGRRTALPGNPASIRPHTGTQAVTRSARTGQRYQTRGAVTFDAPSADHVHVRTVSPDGTVTWSPRWIADTCGTVTDASPYGSSAYQATMQARAARRLARDRATR